MFEQFIKVNKINNFRATATFNRPNDTTQYAAGDAVTNSTSAPAVLQFTVGDSPKVEETKAQTIVITDIVIASTAKQSTLPTFNLWLFNQTFAATNDNSAFDITDAVNSSGGRVIPVSDQYSSNSNSRVQASNLTTMMTLANGDTKIYGELQVTNAYTPVAQEQFDIIISGYRI